MSPGGANQNQVRVRCVWCNTVSLVDRAWIRRRNRCPSCKMMTEFVEVKPDWPFKPEDAIQGKTDAGGYDPFAGETMSAQEVIKEIGAFADSPDPTIVDEVFTLRKRIGQGGTAFIYAASVDLEKFDYTTLYAYTQVSAENHARRRAKADAVSISLRSQHFSAGGMRALLEAASIPMPGPIVALKISLENIIPERFEAEWKNLLCLNHPNLVEVYGGGTYKGRAYYAMELLSQTIVPNAFIKAFTLRQRIQSVLDGTKGVGHLHQNGLIHRDLKPANMVVFHDPSGGLSTKVMDLGLGKSIHDDMQMTQTAAFMGTPSYMSPEQMSSSRDVDCRSDIYSLGACLYEYATGLRPYHDKTKVFDLISDVVQGEKPAAPNVHAPGLPSVLVSIIQTAMAHAPEKRYQTAEDLIQDLQRFLDTEQDAILSQVSLAEPTGLRSAALAGDDSYLFERLVGQKSKRTKTRSKRNAKLSGRRKSDKLRKVPKSCPVCNADLTGKEERCPFCGAETQIASLDICCPACGMLQPPDNDFCGSCGAGMKKIPTKGSNARQKMFRCHHCEHLLTEYQTWCPACGRYNGKDKTIAWMLGMMDNLTNLWHRFWPVLVSLIALMVIIYLVRNYESIFNITPTHIEDDSGDR